MQAQAHPRGIKGEDHILQEMLNVPSTFLPPSEARPKAETPLHAPRPGTQHGAALRMTDTPVRGPPRMPRTLSEK